MTISDIITEKHLGNKYIELFDAVRSGVSSAAFGMSFSGRCLTVSKVAGAVYVLPDELAAGRAAEFIGELIGEDGVVLVPPRDEVFLYKKSASDTNMKRRVSAYSDLIRKPKAIVVTSATALIQRIALPVRVAEGAFTIRRGDNIDTAELAARLTACGYRRMDAVATEGEFSVRGDIVDIYVVGARRPVRLDFFDTEIERIKTFDPFTQISEGEVKSVDMIAATDVFLSKEDRTEVLSKLVNIQGNSRLNEIIQDVTALIEAGSNSPMLSYVLPLMRSHATLLDYIDASRPVFLDEPKQIEARLDAVYREHMFRFESLLESGEVYRESLGQLETRQAVMAELARHTETAFQLIASKNAFFIPRKILSFLGGAIPKYNQNITEFENDLRGWRSGGYNVLIAGGSAADNIAVQLVEHGFNAAVSDTPRFSGITVCREELTTGFILHEMRAVVIGTYDIISKKRKLVKRRNKQDVFVAPNVGDYVVHTVHGIGICRGVKQMDGQFGCKDFVTVEYAGGDMLYVPIDQMDLLSRYSGGENPRLSKIGGKEFERLKAKVKADIREMAIDLHRLYLERTARIGYAFPVDNALQAEFEERFPHAETEDQLKAVAEIKTDMESTKVMDRLLCGDVGYGKTEVAFRAVFKAVAAGKQAAMLSPTTILSEQHYNTALARFKDFGIRIAVLNRFKSDAECRKIIDKLKNGEIDFIIGTHRLLSADVAFKDLGLLIVDEEQRFGVEHKEKIKSIKSCVDVLSMSATPIPRTLHMSMVGIRDISVLETPPQERLPVQSYIIEETDAVIADAITKELSRGGQVFVMINRVERISSVAAWIQQLVPSAEVITMHGQMNEQVLENAVYSFYNHVKNVLVCTTIIENGIDLPNANTLIILDSDKLGLSQLYQLRGRVGRSNRLAYCYFTYRQGKVLSEDSYKRLSAIMEFSDFGSGFKIAMRDLEIRGAGDVLGSRQHGHMDKVGYDMYVRLLKECVDDLRGQSVKKIETTIDAQIEAFISEDYITGNEARMRVYRRIAETSTFEERDRLVSELNDIYGNVPEGTLSLIDISLIKKLAENIGAASVVIKKSGAGICFNDNTVISNKKVMAALSLHPDECILGFTDKPVITFKTADMTMRRVAQSMLRFLKSTI